LRRLTRSSAAGTAGFTLIEVVVAMAVLAVMMASIGSLVGAGVRGSHALDEHLVLVETTRALQAEIADRGTMKFGASSGETLGRRWRLDVAPFLSAEADKDAKTPWEPVTENITVRSSYGTTVSVTTLRLRRRPPQ
jgi:general secretion pathway protein I